MAEKIKVDMHMHKLDALKVGLYRAGKDFQTEINETLSKLYAEYVSKEEQKAVDEMIYRDSLPYESAYERVRAVRIRKQSHLSDYGIYTAGGLFSLVSVCRALYAKTGRVTADNAGVHILRDSQINETTFNVLADAVNKDERVKGVYDFDSRSKFACLQ